tara:strand:- start:110 stop:1087 length:978 start_codon:yes stop_codon:yes gene_type:complete
MNKQTYFITGGTGSFSKKFIYYLVKNKLAKKIIIFSRDEYKQMILKDLPFIKKNSSIFRFFIGDVRDKNRLDWALLEDIDVVIHSAALKQVPTTEYNPFETVQTNILGSQNLIEVCIKKNIKKVLNISTDKAVSPINLYGSTKLTAEKLFVTANVFKGQKRSKFSVVRYGNVMGSRGSVLPVFLSQKKNNFFTITNKKMTRFNITLSYAAKFVSKCSSLMKGGEIFIPKSPSYRIMDLAKAVDKNKKIKIIGIRTGEKMHEELVSSIEFPYAIETKNLYIIYPLKKSKKMDVNELTYNSQNNKDFLSIREIQKLIEKNKKDFDSL